MELLVEKRKPIRSSYTRAVNSILQELEKESPEEKFVKTKLATLERLSVELSTFDTQILNAEFDSNDEFESEYAKVEEYKEKLDLIRVETELFFNRQMTHSTVIAPPNSNKRKLKLPLIELKQFGGDIKDWLPFWGQFRRIHEDKEIQNEDKMHYLVQATIPGTRPRDIVNSFPATAENYEKVIESLRNRFGREELLVEFYIRELLNLIIKNVTDQKEKFSISELYDKLESYLRSLESIGMTSDKYAAMLFPLVESCIPEEILRVWLRNHASIITGENSHSEKLKQLLLFLRNEVEGEQRISLAKTGFKLIELGTKKESRKDKKYQDERSVPTANDLFSGHNKVTSHNEKNSCIFCEKNHESRDCFVAQKMSLNQKNDEIKKKNGCFFCLKVGHRAKQCKTNVRCLLCSKRHWGVMCPNLQTNQKRNDVEKKKEEETQNVSLASTSFPDEVFLQTLLINVDANKRQKTVRALIDTGSQRSYILKETAADIGCQPCGSEALIHALFGGVTTKKEIHKRYEVNIRSLEGDFSRRLNLLEQSKICGPVISLQPGPWIEELKQKNIHVSDIGRRNLKIEVLIGADVAGALLTGRVHKLENGLTAVESLLGWTVMGKMNDCISERNALSMSSITTSMLTHSTDIENLWKLEAIGIADPKENKTDSELEEAVWNHFHKTLKMVENRYEVSLPWINEKEALPSNREIAEKRLISTTKKLILKGKFEAYNAVFQEWLESGVIEEVPEEEKRVENHYIPHRPIFKDNSTTAVRPVFDASCKQKDFLSLNDCLAKGQNLIELIPGLLLDFRQRNIGIISDIKRAFLLISVQRSDRDFLRFLWWKNSEKKEMREFRHCRVVFGLKCSPFLLEAVIHSHLNRCEPSLKEVATKLKNSFYVDNCVTSVNSKEEAEYFIAKSTELMASANFELRGWEQTQLNKEKGTACEPLKVLGLLWDKFEDSLFCDIPDVELNDLPVTRRNVLSIAQRVFDPVGFTCPFTLLPKLDLQKSWETKMSWDAELPEDIKRKFLKWVKELSVLSSLKIPRLVMLSEGQSFSLHMFADASRGSYACAVYLRSQNKENVKVTLLQAKARVAPLKKISIPRLELLACLIGVRLASFVKKKLEVENLEEYYWTDSSTALFWIKNVEAWSTFVNNRVSEIRILTNREDWYHVPGAENPADLPSRGCSVKKLIESRWWEGPHWLALPKEEWPRSIPIDDKEKVNTEKRKSIIVSLSNVNDMSSRIFDYFSKYKKILRMIGWIHRFIENTRKRREEREAGELKVNELTRAEKSIVKIIQHDSFSSEDIKKLKSISVFKDDEGILRVKTRLTERKDQENFIYPMLLPKNHKIVEKLIIDKHLSMSHAGIHVLISKLRETFWIIKSRATIRKALYGCVRCRRHESKRLQTVPATLPKDRVRDARVFEIVGVDLAGPLILKDKRKAWIILFTCAVFRAVHLELILSLSTQGFLLGLRRFIARRGRPSIIYSDNGSNFVGSSNLLKSIDWNIVEREATTNKIDWKFSPPAAPWWGGFWERLVQMIKKLLRRVLGQSSLNYEELMSVLCDCEATVNARPLTYVSEDSDDLIPLTPSLFLGEIPVMGVPDLDHLDKVDFNKRLRYIQNLRELLRKRFRSEYLGLLVQRPSTVPITQQIKIGDIVLVECDNKRKVLWPLAKVTELYPGKDGNIRVVRVKTTSGELVRPIQKIFPLEIPSSLESDEKRETEPQDANILDSKSPNKNAVPDLSKELKTVVTRSGRQVRLPSRFLT